MKVREIEPKTIQLYEIEKDDQRLFLLMEEGELIFLVPISV